MSDESFQSYRERCGVLIGEGLTGMHNMPPPLATVSLDYEKLRLKIFWLGEHLFVPSDVEKFLL